MGLTEKTHVTHIFFDHPNVKTETDKKRGAVERPKIGGQQQKDEFFVPQSCANNNHSHCGLTSNAVK